MRRRGRHLASVPPARPPRPALAPRSNWGNWVAAAGLTGGRVNKFNVTKQSHDYDPEGDYIRTWVSAAPAAEHQSGCMSGQEGRRAGSRWGGQEGGQPVSGCCWCAG